MITATAVTAAPSGETRSASPQREAESATGNLATEDLVWMLHGLGIETGVDLAQLVATSAWMAAQLGRPSPSRVVQALENFRNASVR